MAVYAGSTYKRTKVGLNFVLEPTSEEEVTAILQQVGRGKYTELDKVMCYSFEYCDKTIAKPITLIMRK